MHGTSRGRQQAHLNKKQAIRRLGVSRNVFWELQRDGVLRPHRIKGKLAPVFLAVEVDVVREAIEKVEHAPWKAIALSKQALSAVRILENRVAAIQDKLGISHVVLERDEDSIHQVIVDILREPGGAEIGRPDWVRYWGAVFFAIDDLYLDLVGQYMNEEEPWKPFHDFSTNVLRNRPVDTIQVWEELRHAYNFFQAGRQNLIYAAYIYCHRNKDRETAKALFDRKANPIEAVIDALPF